jgi:hypothetical protein
VGVVVVVGVVEEEEEEEEEERVVESARCFVTCLKLEDQMSVDEGPKGATLRILHTVFW